MIVHNYKHNDWMMEYVNIDKYMYKIKYIKKNETAHLGPETVRTPKSTCP